MTARDLHGLPLSCDAAAARAFDHAVLGYVRNRADTPQRVQGLIGAAPDVVMVHVLKGYLVLLSFKLASVPVARECLVTARRLEAAVTAREKAHIAALAAWVDGDTDQTLAVWEEILDQHPRDVLAFRLHHFVAFWQGRPDLMAAEAEQALPAWSAELPGWASLLACRCFAHEELGNYGPAEEAGRAAIAADAGDLWAAHAVAHIMEMQGRREEGIEWLAGLEPNWEGGNNLKHHLWWHRGLYHFERGEFEAVLALYDRNFRNLASPLTVAQPDLYIDVQNAASMLFRLERQGVGVGDRWVEIADKAEARIGDCLSAFTLPHWMMALAATRRWDACARMLEGMEAFARAGVGSAAPIVRDCALPISRAVVARARGDHAGALAAMRPALGGMPRLGGSHAQQDVLEQLFLDCAQAAGARDDVALILDRVGRRFPVPPARRRGYADAAM